MKTAVAQDKQSIGYVGIGHVDKNVKALVFDQDGPLAGKRLQRHV